MIAPLSKTMAALAILAMAAPLAAPSVARAQTYGYGYPHAYNQSAYGQSGYGQPSYNQYGYNQPTYVDPCRSDARNRTATGGVLGAAIGAIAGSQLAARGRRGEGTALGGVLGAAIGAGVGNNSANCNARKAAYNDSYAPPPPPPAYGYDNRVYDNRVYDDRGYDTAYDDRYSQPIYDTRYSQPQPDNRYNSTDNCRLAESVIRMPDGRTDTRYVRTCPDQSGRYRVVD